MEEMFCCSDIPTWNLIIGDEIIASGEYPNKKVAHTALAQEALDYLKRYCFTIIRVSTSFINTTSTTFDFFGFMVHVI